MLFSFPFEGSPGTELSVVLDGRGGKLPPAPTEEAEEFIPEPELSLGSGGRFELEDAGSLSGRGGKLDPVETEVVLSPAGSGGMGATGGGAILAVLTIFLFLVT
jgi:hypothetical protein